MRPAIGVDPGTKTAGVAVIDIDGRPQWMASLHKIAPKDKAAVWHTWERWRASGWSPTSHTHADIMRIVCRDLEEWCVCVGAVEAVRFFARGDDQTGRVGGSKLVELADAAGMWAGALIGAGVSVRRPVATEWRRFLGLHHHTAAKAAEAAAVAYAKAAGVPLPMGAKGGRQHCGAVAEAYVMARWAQAQKERA